MLDAAQRILEWVRMVIHFEECHVCSDSLNGREGSVERQEVEDGGSLVGGNDSRGRREFESTRY